MIFFKKKKQPKNELIHLHNHIQDSFQNVQKDTSYILKWLHYFYQKNIQQEELIKHLVDKHSSQQQNIDTLHDRHSKQEKEIKHLQEELKYIPKSKEEIRQIVDEFYSYERILNRIKELDQNIDDLRKSHSDLDKNHQKLDQEHQEISPKIEALKSELATKSAQKHPEITPKIEVSGIDQLRHRLEKLEAKKATIKEKIIKRITKNSKDYIKSIVLSYIKKYGKITALQLKEMVVEEQGLCSKSSFYRLLEEIEEEPDIGVIKKGKEKHYMSKISSTPRARN